MNKTNSILDFDENTVHHQLYEITVQVRDNLGNSTGKTRSFCTDEGFKIWEFYNKNAPWIWDGEEYKLKGGRKGKRTKKNK